MSLRIPEAGSDESTFGGRGIHEQGPECAVHAETVQ
jgi:hypothetical protein